MEILTRAQINDICQDGIAIDSKGGFPSVVIHPDGRVTKFWARKKRFFSSATFCPYPNRFVNNARALENRGVNVPKILQQAALKNSHVKIVTYQGLSGTSIRELLKTSPEKVNTPNLCAYFHQLHEKGILFRGIHLGNIIQISPNTFGLIDFTDVDFFKKPLSLKQRASNLAIPLRYTQDVDLMKHAKLPDVAKCYLDIINPSSDKRLHFLTIINKIAS